MPPSHSSPGQSPAQRLTVLSLALEAAVEAEDWSTVRSLLDERDAAISTLKPGEADLSALTDIGGRTQGKLEGMRDDVKLKLRALAHSGRVAGAYRAAQAKVAKPSNLNHSG